jgi:hypothetical protein
MPATSFPPRRDHPSTLRCLGLGAQWSSPSSPHSASLKPTFAVGVANAKCSSLATIVCKNRVEQSMSALFYRYTRKKLANCTHYGFRAGDGIKVLTAWLTGLDTRRSCLRSLWFTLQRTLICIKKCDKQY